ncbi:hypothetical protein LINPERHAP1_LOCUS24445 [Linum perenne]
MTQHNSTQPIPRIQFMLQFYARPQPTTNRYKYRTVHPIPSYLTFLVQNH